METIMKLEINEKQLALLNQMVCKAIQDVQYIQWSNTPEAVKKYNDGVLDNLQDLEYKIRAKQGDPDFKYWLDEDDAKDLDPIGGWNVPQSTRENG